MADLEGPIRRREEDLKAQQVMREEMEAAVKHRPKPSKPEHPQCEPTKLGDLMEEEFGTGLPSDADVSRMAHLLIEEHGKGLKLGIKQWGIIQRIVEHAVVFDPQEL